MKWLFENRSIDLVAAISKRQTIEQIVQSYGIKGVDLRHPLIVSQVHLDMCRSHANVLGMKVGPMEGAIPTEAVIDVEIRVAPSVDEDADQLDQMVNLYLYRVANETISDDSTAEVEILPGSGEGYRFALPDDTLVKTLMQSYGTVGVDLPLSISCFGSIPEGYAFVKQLGIPFMCGGVGRGGNFHAPNEWIVKDDYPRFKLWFAEFLEQFAINYAK